MPFLADLQYADTPIERLADGRGYSGGGRLDVNAALCDTGYRSALWPGAECPLSNNAIAACCHA